MAQWGNTDDAANNPNWVAAQFKTVANTENQTALFANSTANTLGTNQTVATYTVSTAEAKAARLDGTNKPAHAGHVLRVEGQGGRAGRVQVETLVAMGSITGDSENTVYTDVAVKIVTQPLSNTVSVAVNANAVAVYTVAVDSTPGATVVYQWEANTGSGFANAANTSRYSGANTATLSVFGNTSANQQVRVVVSATGATPKTSDSVTYVRTT